MSDAAQAVQIVLLASLFLVAAVHTKSRFAGAIAAAVWCVGAVGFGFLAFPRPPVAFLGIATPAWMYFAFIGGLFVFNVAVIARALRKSRRQPPTTSTTG